MKKTINTVVLILILLIFTTPQIYAGNKNDKQDPLSSPTPSPTPSPQFTITPSPTPINLNYGWFVINEIGWAGTEASSDDQWIEIYNNNGLGPGDNYEILVGSTSGNCGGWISSDFTGYQILEIDDDAISDIPAAGILSGNLSPEGEFLTLEFPDGTILDTVDCSTGWFAGTTNGYYSMERINPVVSVSGSDPTNWATNNPAIAHNGKDRDGNDINGTPKSWNSNCIEPSVTVTPSPIASPTPTPSSTAPPTPSLPPTPPPTITPTHIPWELDSCDYNGDGTADIAVFREGSGLWAIRNLTRIYFGTEYDIPVNGDYNGDGTTDVGIFRSDSGLWAVREFTRTYFGNSTDTPVPLRFNPSSACNIGIFRESTGLWAIKDLTRVYFGSSGDVPVPGDYNGDGTKELGIFRESSGLWALREGSRFYFGQSADTPIPGNYGENGICSAAIFRGSSGLWAIRGISRIYYGTIGDWAVPADYTGDGTPAVGIFRESSGLWAVRGVTRAYYGRTGDIPVIR